MEGSIWNFTVFKGKTGNYAGKMQMFEKNFVEFRIWTGYHQKYIKNGRMCHMICGNENND